VVTDHVGVRILNPARFIPHAHDFEGDAIFCEARNLRRLLKNCPIWDYLENSAVAKIAIESEPA
jgi:hypothetical protein